MIEKRYNSHEIEKACLVEWKKNKIFKYSCKNNTDKFSIMMPPPNITGSLHMGHALTFTLQDILIRFNKKLGKEVLWQCGTDHAGIATEIIVERELQKQKITKKKIGRKKFIEKIWNWKSKYGDLIINQMNKLGTCVDWSRSRFTMDDGLSKSVNKVFISLYNEGIIYKDKRLVNWDPKLQTAISDLEVNQKEVEGKMWYIKYDVIDSPDKIIVATTRPETIFADSAIAIHSKNKNLSKFTGKYALIPILKKKIPIILDDYADPTKGSGAVKITPSHDFNDFKIGKKHNLEVINIFDKFANLNNLTPKEYRGMNRFDARKKIIQFLKETGTLHEEKNNLMTIPVGDRSGEIIEPYLTEQWFCDAKKLAKPIKKFIKNSKIRFHPSNWINSFNYWIDNIEPWCISRQIWWGHRIPVWYTDCGKIIVEENYEKAYAKAKKILKTDKLNLIQEDDVLDTWFSSALWPFSSLGWPKKNNDIKNFYPSSVLVTGFDIIFFWVARMVMMGIHFMKEIPFKNIYIHPLVKDQFGKKMSKSKGNVIDPLDLIDLYGSDALRFTLVSLSTQGRDIKLSNKLVEQNRNFITKIWNSARFYELNEFSHNKKFKPQNSKLHINQWIYSQYIILQKKIIKNIMEYKFNFASNNLYHFIWSDFCDLYIEFLKPYLKKKENFNEISNMFAWVFKNLLILSNPFIPFITDEISRKLHFTNSYSLFNENLPKMMKIKNEKNKASFKKLVIFIKNLRSSMKENNISKIKNGKLYYFSERKNEINFLNDNFIILESIFELQSLEFFNEKDTNIKSFISSELKFCFLVDEDNSSDFKIKKQIQFYQNEIKFFTKKLSNDDFLNKAPKKIVTEQKKKLDLANKNLSLLINSLKN